MKSPQGIENWYLTGCLVVFLLLPAGLSAQFRYAEDHRHVHLETGYFGILDLSSDQGTFRNGQRIGAAYSLVNKYKEKLQRKTDYNRIVDRDIYAGLSVAHYVRKDLHHALMISAGPSYKITIPEGMYFDFGANIGYMHTFLKGEGFAFDGQQVSGTGRHGNDVFTLEGVAGFGWNFQKSNDYPVFLFLKGGIMTYFPTNGSWLLQPELSGGIGWVIERTKESYE